MIMLSQAPSGLEVSPWYQLGDYILSVEVQDGITYIGSSCFWDCYNLQQVTISSSVTHIGAYAFLQIATGWKTFIIWVAGLI